METNVNNFEVLIDISSTATPDYEKLCVLPIVTGKQIGRAHV